MTQKDSDQIFSNLDEILITSDNFYNDLTNNYNPATGTGISETFIKHVRFALKIAYLVLKI